MKHKSIIVFVFAVALITFSLSASAQVCTNGNQLVIDGTGSEPALIVNTVGWQSIRMSRDGYKTYQFGSETNGFSLHDYDNDVYPFVIESSSSNNSLLYLKDGKVGIGKTSPAYKLDVNGTVQAAGYVTGDILFQKGDKPLWRMYEEEDGLYMESVVTGKRYKLSMQEVTEQ